MATVRCTPTPALSLPAVTPEGGRYAILTALVLLLGASLLSAWRADAGTEVLAMRRDLRDVAAAQQAYFAEHGRFAAAFSEAAVRLSDGVAPVRMLVSASQFTLEVTTRAPGAKRCRITVRPGDADPPRCAR